MEGKVCPRCQRLKVRKDFSRSTARTDRMAVYCKECENTYRKKKLAERKQDELYGII